MSPSERAAFLEEVARMVATGALTLGGAVRVLRVALLGRDRKGFAKLVRVSERELAKLEDDVANPTLATLRSVFSPFGFRIGLLSGAQVTPDPPSPYVALIDAALSGNKRRRSSRGREHD